MKKIGVIISVICFLFCLVGCNNQNEKKLSIEKTFNLLDEPITNFPYYNLKSCDDYEITLFNKKEYNKQLDLIEKEGIEEGDYELFEEYYLQIDFKSGADASGFLGINDYNVSTITVWFEYEYKSSNDDSETKITDISFGFKDNVNEDSINKVLCKYFEKHTEDFTRNENKTYDYEYVYKYNEDKGVLFGDSISIWEYNIFFYA